MIADRCAPGLPVMRQASCRLVLTIFGCALLRNAAAFCKADPALALHWTQGNNFCSQSASMKTMLLLQSFTFMPT
jgi:hypothetical protein